MEEAIRLTKADLQDIISVAVTAGKAPNVLEQKKIDEEQKRTEAAQSTRKALSGQVLQDLENRRNIQRICSHEHANGDTHCVYVQEQKGPGYFICQKNQCIIRPGTIPAGYKGNDLYDTALFNKLFQKVRSNEIFG